MNQIHTSKCDTCDKHAEGVLFYANGTPVFFQCATCNPEAHKLFSNEECDQEAETLPGFRIQRTLPAPAQIVVSCRGCHGITSCVCEEETV